MGFTENASGKVVILIVLLTVTIGSFLSKAIKTDAQTDMKNLSLKNEVQHAIERGLRWLSTKPDPKGYWSQPDHPALSGLVLTAFMSM